MITVVSLWIAALVLGTALIVLWNALGIKHRRELNKLHTKYAQQQHLMRLHMQEAKRQIGQLQHDLAAARLQVKRLTLVAATPVQSDSRANKTLQSALDDAWETSRRLPVDGFADTRPFRHSQHDADLLLR